MRMATRKLAADQVATEIDCVVGADFTEAETAKHRDDALRRALSTPPVQKGAKRNPATDPEASSTASPTSARKRGRAGERS